MTCERCGASNAPDRPSCAYCGSYLPVKVQREEQRPLVVNVYQAAPVPDSNAAAVPLTSLKSRWVALLLCWFFGGLGVHRFYVGKIGTGILYLLTLGFFGIGVFVDFLVILFGGFRDKDGLKLHSK